MCFINVLASVAPSHTPLTTAKSGEDGWVELAGWLDWPADELNVSAWVVASPASAAPPSLGVETLRIDDSLVNSVLLVAAAWSPSSCSLFKKGALSFGGCVSDVMENAGGGPPTVAEITTEMPTLASGGLALLAGQVLCVPMRGGRLRDPWRGVGCAVLTLDKSLAVVVLHEVDEENDMGAERLHVAFGLGD